MLICGVASIVPLSVFDWHKKYIVYVVIIVRLSGYGLNVNVAIFLDTVNVKLCVVVVPSNDLYLCRV